jgi:phosphomannomutase
LYILDKKDLQKVIDEVCSKYENARSFVRTSGTEDLVRIYVESSNLDDTEIITKHIYDFIQKNYS